MQKIFQYFLTRIILYLASIAGAVALTEWSGRWLLGKTSLGDNMVNTFIAIADSVFALFIYIFLTTTFEKRRARDVSWSSFGKNAFIGFGMGLFLQSAFIFIIYLAGGYSVTRINPASHLLPSFSIAFTAGVVGEILIRGTFFRLTEEKLGTPVALIILVTLFGLIHSFSPWASVLSVSAAEFHPGIGILSGCG
ncbi:MAG TPA: CPBP family glutamic-type intramembrane protease, partial [Cyclobacteriaceae bacterium]|nr:CPBP family glutamic-type intramembrane protease [Cyclobacteriaceae bacterium]